MQKTINDASSSIKGIIYQFYVALERCFLLESDQKLWIEKFGDVTISGDIQIETKLYKGNLNDLHRNFWNTLANWMDKSFDHMPYKELILYTTQNINQNSKLYNWNKSSAEEKLEIINQIIKSSKKNNNKISENNRIKEKFLQYDKDNLLIILSKVYISYNSPNLIEIKKKLIEVHAKTISELKKTEFIEALIGFITNPSKCESNWEITFEEFSEKVSSLANHFNNNIMRIPSIENYHISDIEYCEDKLFIKKIIEINYESMKYEAFKDYSFLKIILFKEFNNCEYEMQEYNIYSNNLKRIFEAKYRRHARNIMGDIISESQNFFDIITETSPEQFGNFKTVPIEFRNGIYHDLLNIEVNKLKWKLKDE